jgi:hypothetical protein
VPEVLVVNKQVLSTLKDPWVLTDEIIHNADVIIDENGSELNKQND